MKKQTLKYPMMDIDPMQIKSKWFEDILSQWEPDKKYIEDIIERIECQDYIAPVIVVRENGMFYIINGHHRYYACLKSKKKKIKCLLIDGTFKDSEPLRKAEVLLKEFDQKTGYKYQFSSYLDCWAASADKHDFINRYRPIYSIFPRLRRKLSAIFKGIKIRRER